MRSNIHLTMIFVYMIILHLCNMKNGCLLVLYPYKKYENTQIEIVFITI